MEHAALGLRHRVLGQGTEQACSIPVQLSGDVRLLAVIEQLVDFEPELFRPGLPNRVPCGGNGHGISL